MTDPELAAEGRAREQRAREREARALEHQREAERKAEAAAIRTPRGRTGTRRRTHARAVQVHRDAIELQAKHAEEHS